MNLLLNLLYGVVTVLSFPALLGLLYLWIFTGPSPLDGLPDPIENREDSKEEEWERSQID